MNSPDTALEADTPASTYEVFNQTTPLEDYNAWSGDNALRERWMCCGS